ncbi:MAG: hypothetical protein LBD36_00690 [Holosporales bacterium]|jgi:uncharacterized protein YukE|nr:hypothetical protein [Holosporales bacterium]
MLKNSVKIKMTVFVSVIATIVCICAKNLLPAFMYNPWINSLILLTFLSGVVCPFIYIKHLSADRRFWLFYKSQCSRNVQNCSQSNVNVGDIYSPVLSPLLTLPNGQFRLAFSSEEIQTTLMSLERKLSERHTFSRYVIGVLILLGLLGTFCGLTQTVGAITNSLNSLSFDGIVSSELFQLLKDGIQSPLSGMGVAFSSSIFGLVGSLILGLLDLLQGQSEKQFYDEVEDMLVSRLKYRPNSTNSGSTYVVALIEQIAEALDSFKNVITQMTENWSRSANVFSEVHSAFSTSIAQSSKYRDAYNELNDTLKACITTIQHYSEEQKARPNEIVVMLKPFFDKLDQSCQHIVQETKDGTRMIARTISTLTEYGDESFEEASRRDATVRSVS